MDRKIFLIVTAGGTGTRMGADKPKQFLTLGGKPILRRTIEVFLEACPSAAIVTVLPRESVAQWKEYCVTSGFTAPQMIVEGGFTRFHSVKNALSRIPDGAIVMVHDGVRPFVSAELVRRMLERMENEEALIPVIPSTDTLRLLSKDGNGVLTATGRMLDRSEVYCVQTPQIFRSELLKASYSEPYDPSFTDDGSVVSRHGGKLSFIEGERWNIKITTPEDLRLARALVSLG